MKYLSIALAVVAVAYMRVYDAGSEAAQRKGAEWRFRAGRILRWFVIGGLGGMFLLGVKVLTSGSVSEQAFGIAVSLAALPAYLFLLPRTIVVSPAGLTRRGWLYQRHFFPWNQVRRAARVPAMHQILIYGNDGLILTHTRYHAGRNQFVDLLRQYHVAVS